jgi:hypothetical protein
MDILSCILWIILILVLSPVIVLAGFIVLFIIVAIIIGALCLPVIGFIKLLDWIESK